MAADLAKLLNDHVNARACPLYVRTASDAKRPTPRTGADSVRTSTLTCSFTVTAQLPQRQEAGDSAYDHQSRLAEQAIHARQRRPDLPQTERSPGACLRTVRRNRLSSRPR